MLVQRRGDENYEWSLYKGNGQIGVEWYFRETSSLPTSVMLYHLEPGAEEGSHLHLAGHPDSCSTNSSEELYVVTRGQVTMLVDGEQVALGPGDAVYTPAGALHGVRNDSHEAAELVLLFGPAEPGSSRGRASGSPAQ